MIVLTYAQSGASRLMRLLDRSSIVACTTGTGLLPLCELAAASWRRIDNRDGPLPALAIASIRSMADAMIVSILSREGRPRWCETAFSPPAVAETFSQIYPGTRYLCLHRSCVAVVTAAIRANPWGLAGTPFAEFAAVHPASAAAAVAAYWAAITERLLQFEDAHPDMCLRVRHEDLTDQPEQTAGEIFSFLNFGPVTQTCLWHLDDDRSVPADHHDSPSPSIQDQFPAQLLERVNRLHDRLEFPPLSPLAASGKA